MKIVVAPDSFKGTMSAKDVAENMKKAILDSFPDTQIITKPVADGGEGTIEAIQCQKHYVTVSGPYFDKVNAYYGILGEKAIIEMAVCAGLPLVGSNKNPMKTTTYGVGEMITDALNKGCRNISLALGGSSTNDFGCGMAAALGVEFYNKSGEKFVPVGGTLSEIDRIDFSNMDSRIADTEFNAMCDVTNPLYGPMGASHVFAPQKGAGPEMVEKLEKGIIHLSNIVKRDCGTDVSDIPGSGAAGGMGGGVIAFLRGRLKRGIEVVFDTISFDECLDGCDLVLTGEGKFDSQSLNGKCVSGVASHAEKKGIPCIVIAGCIENNVELSNGITAAFSIQGSPMEFKKAIKNTGVYLYDTTRNVLRTFVCGMGGKID